MRDGRRSVRRGNLLARGFPTGVRSAALLLLASTLLAGAPQDALDLSVGIRPGAIRVGGTAILTVRVVSRGPVVEGIEFFPEGGVEVSDIQDRRSTHVTPAGEAGQVVEADFHLLGVEAGRHALPPILIYVDGKTVQAEAPVLEVAAAPIQWGVPRSRARDQAREERARENAGADRVRPQGVPPQEGELRSQIPSQPGWQGTLYPDSAREGSGAQWYSYPGQYPQAVPSYPWGTVPPGAVPYPGGTVGYPMGGGATPGYPNGAFGYPAYGSGMAGYPLTQPGYSMGGAPLAGPGWPDGGGGEWAPTARSDPWWPEMVPELLSYQTVARDAEGLVTLSAGLTPEAVYVGQQVTHVATAAFAPGAQLRLGGDPEYLPPHPEGFWIVDLPQVGSGAPVASQGEVDQAYTFKRALFPLQAGDYLIPPARVVPMDRPGTGVQPGFGAGQASGLPHGAGGATAGSANEGIATAALPVSVLPLPTGRAPAGYTGAVGRYRVEAYLTPSRVAVGETAILTVRIIGVGNVQGLPSPELTLFSEVEMAPFSDWALPEVVDGVVGGAKTFNWMVVPVAPGSVRLGPVLYPYFDPYLGNFGIAESSELLLDVTEFQGGGGD